jgi:hypothetical protein
VVVSSASSLIPEAVKTKFHEWREYSKQVEGRIWGNEEANEPVKKAGWGVEEAEELNKTGASEYYNFLPSSPIRTLSSFSTCYYSQGTNKIYSQV